MNPAGGPGSGAPVQSVDRALALLELLAQAPEPLGVGALAQDSGLAQATVHRLLQSLVGRGFARQEADHRYSPGVALWRLSESAARAAARAAQPHLLELVASSGETANLAVLEGDRAVYVAQAPSPHRLRTFAEVGHRVPVHSTAVGKALIAHLDDAAVAAIAHRAGLAARTAATITDLADLLGELAEVRRLGYALDDGEEADGVCCVAVRVAGPTGRCFGALSVSGPATRVRASDADEIAARLAPVAERLAATLARGG